MTKLFVTLISNLYIVQKKKKQQKLSKKNQKTEDVKQIIHSFLQYVEHL